MKQIVNTTIRDITEIDDEVLARDYCSINDATIRMNIKHAQYTRRLVHEGKLDAILVQMKHYQKWFILIASINERVKFSRKLDSRRFLLRIREDDEAVVREAIDKLKIEFSLELQFQKKQK